MHAPRERALLFQFGGHRLKRNTRTRERDGTRTVEGGNRYRSIVPRDECDGFVLRQSDREHRSFAASAFLHETRSQRDDPCRFFEGKDAGNAGGRDLTDAVADDGRRLDAPRFPERRERHLHGKNGGLTNLRPMHLARFFRAAEFFEKREARPWTKRRVATLDRLDEKPARAASIRGPFPTIAALDRS